MRTAIRHSAAWVVVLGVMAGAAALAQSRPWTGISAERLLNPEAGDWVSYRRTYDLTAFSALRQIDRSTVRRLRAVWSCSMRDNRRWFATPIVANGLMYVPEGSGRVTAFDAVSGDVVWIHDRHSPPIPPSQKATRGPEACRSIATDDRTDERDDRTDERTRG
jgi:alcohol dehydrogenase (cytochrome c)